MAHEDPQLAAQWAQYGEPVPPAAGGGPAAQAWLNAVPPSSNVPPPGTPGLKPTPEQVAIAAAQGAHAPSPPPTMIGESPSVGGGEHLPGAAKRGAKKEMEAIQNKNAPPARTWAGLDERGAAILAPEAKGTAAQAYMTTPGGMLPHSESVTRTTTEAPPDPESVALTYAAQQMRGQGAYERGLANQGYNENALKLEEDKAKAQDDYVKGRKQRDEWLQRVIGKHRTAIEKMEADVAAEKIKPIDHWARGSLLGVIVAGISGGAAGLSGGENQFLKQVRLSMEERYRAQKDDIAKKERGIDRAGNELDALEKIHGDAETAKLSMFNLQLAGLENQLKKVALQKEGTLEGTKYKEALADIMLARAGYRDEMMKRIHGQLTEKADRVFVPPKTIAIGGTGPARLTKEQRAEIAANKEELEKLGKTEDDLGIPMYESVVKDLNFVIAKGMPTDDKNRVARLLRAGEVNKANELISGYLDTNPDAAARYGQAVDSYLRARSGKAVTVSEKTGIQGVMGAFSKGGVTSGYKAVTSHLQSQQRSAYARHPNIYSRAQRLKAIFDQDAPQSGMPESEQPAEASP